jgi:hypothetical protein
MSRFLAVAHQFVEAGVPVLPVLHRRALVPVAEASVDVAVIQRWHSQHPTAVVGILTGPLTGRVVVEMHRRAAGERSLRELEAQHGALRGFASEVWMSVERAYFVLADPGHLVETGRLAMGLYRHGDDGYVEIPDGTDAEAVAALLASFLEHVPMADGDLGWVFVLPTTKQDRRLAVAGSAPRAARRIELIDDESFQQRTPVADLVEGVLPLGSFAVLFGEAGSFKTFVGIDIALCIATGTPWAGRRVEQGLVVYIVAEGSGAFGARIEAWKRAHHVSGQQGVLLVPRSLSLMLSSAPVRGGVNPALAPPSGDVADLLAALADLPEAPVLIVVDTLARCFNGNENSAEDMGAFVRAIEQLREHTGATVLVLHHSGWKRSARQTGHERGSSALRGATDTTIVTKLSNGSVEVICDKQRDTERFATIEFLPYPVTTSNGQTSLALSWVGAASPQRATLSNTQQEVLAALETAGPEGLTATEWENRAVSPNLSRATFYRVLDPLIARGCVTKNGDRYVPIPEQANQSHGLTPVSPESHETTQVSVSGSHTPLGVRPLRPRVPLKLRDGTVVTAPSALASQRDQKP